MNDSTSKPGASPVEAGMDAPSMTDCSRVASDATPFEQSCLGPPLMPRLNLCWKHSLLPKSVFMRQILESGRRRVLRAREYGEQGSASVLCPPAPTQHMV